MPRDFAAQIGVGFKFTEGDLLAVFGVGLPAVTHDELRFDPKTGKPVAPVTIVEREAGSYLRINGEELDETDVEEIVSALGYFFKCDVTDFGSDGSQCYGFTVGEHLSIPGSAYETHPVVSVGDSLDFDKVCALGTKLKKLAYRLEEAGLKVGKPEVFVMASVLE